MSDVASPVALPLAEIGDLCRRYQVAELSLFGSAIRDGFRSESDLDMLVLFEPGVRIGFLKFAALQRELEALLGRRVDLVPKRGLKPIIREEVLASARVLYASR